MQRYAEGLYLVVDSLVRNFYDIKFLFNKNVLRAAYNGDLIKEKYSGATGMGA